MALIEAARFGFHRIRDLINRRFGRAKGGTDLVEPEPLLLSEQQRENYFRVLAAESPEREVVDERTWSDLEMDQVLSRLNRCITPLGGQYLYARLRLSSCPQDPARGELELCRQLQARPDLATAMDLALRPARGKTCAEVGNLVLGPALSVPAQYRLFYAVAGGALACTIGLLLSPWFFVACMFFWVLSIALHCLYRRSLLVHGPALGGLASVLTCGLGLSKALELSGLAEAQELAALAPTLRAVRKQVSRTFLSQEGVNDLVLVLAEYLNVLCLFELCSLCRALVSINQHRPALRRLYHLVGRLDALNGLARALPKFPAVCVAQPSSEPGFRFEGVYHPLLETPVANHVESAGKSLLFTGTNMAGKTTFVKAVAVNALLGQTLGLCFARSALLPAVRIRTLLNREDKVVAGQSYFFYEATQLSRLQAEAKLNGQQAWFILDEVFRGTNTVERIAASAAVLEDLAEHGLVFATTHDIQLTDLLARHFNSYYFSEIVDEKGARFDYRLQKGACPTRNALRLLAMAGYSKSVLDRAHQVIAANGSEIKPPGGC